ncbi:hypothetical protein IHE45_08G059400 [Dioscorea alata]|uniref:Uncharacterized protein n=1 Tax=Dioscorea alata TaxID=55571 RepID=A0ACB7VJG6_DIOAL|nr:hypothetical protein IHE45_08G059400 [Dioscorea alata]
MGSDRRALLVVFVFLFLAGFGSSTTYISDGVFQSHGSTGRNLLQAKKNCPVNFEFMNYTIITSQCKGPRYPANLCCGALKQFACPYADDLNDLTNDCASTMFSYINLYGKYPPGLFSSECKEGKEGLACPPSSAPQVEDDKSNAEHMSHHLLTVVLLVSVFVLHFLLS